ncbi:glycerol-3-phosphate acyltransferase [Chloroflexota bacterium]
MWDDALIIVGAYLLGAIPVVYLLGRMRGFDLSKEEDMHISLWHKVGRREGFTGIAWDVVKGGVAVVLLDKFTGYGWGTVTLVGLAVVVGLMWPVFLRGRGEKANTTSLGVSAAFCYEALPFLFGPILLGLLVRTVPRFLAPGQSMSERLKFGGPPSNSLPLGMLFGFGLFPLGCWIISQPWETVAVSAAIFVLIVIKRITAGLREDLETASNKKSVILNRALFDRSYI